MAVNRGYKPLRYTREAAASASSSYRSVTDNQPGKTFKDPTGKLHVVPDKKLGRIGSKARVAVKTSGFDLRNL